MATRMNVLSRGVVLLGAALALLGMAHSGALGTASGDQGEHVAAPPATGDPGTSEGQKTLRGTEVFKATDAGFGDSQPSERAGAGRTRQSERAVAGALSWLARHQSPTDGSWSLSGFRSQCKDATCTGGGAAKADSGATALALMPFLAAGQTHVAKGPYKNNVQEGLLWLMKNQEANGDLSAKAGQRMYSHGLATIALCEAFGLTKDKKIGIHAQSAIGFIESAQNTSTGGWRYEPGQEGDTSVLGWQVMALKSAQMAGLRVNPKCFDGARKWLKAASAGSGGQFSYTPRTAPTPSMTAVGLLCSQYLGVKRSDPILGEGTGILMRNLPDNNARDVYYWYYATQVMHNVSGPDWDAWNRKLLQTLLESQCTQGCARGSWDPDKPTSDRWGSQGGRLMVTSLATLSLEVYYHYLPLYKLRAEEPAKPGAGGAKPAAKPEPAPPPGKKP